MVPPTCEAHIHRWGGRKPNRGTCMGIRPEFSAAEFSSGGSSVRTGQPHRRCVLRCTGLTGPGGLSVWTRFLPSTEVAVVPANGTGEGDDGVRGEPGARSAERQDSDACDMLHQHGHTDRPHRPTQDSGSCWGSEVGSVVQAGNERQIWSQEATAGVLFCLLAG